MPADSGRLGRGLASLELAIDVLLETKAADFSTADHQEQLRSISAQFQRLLTHASTGGGGIPAVDIRLPQQSC